MALSIGIAFGSVLIFASIGAFILAGKVEESTKIAGMLVGVLKNREAVVTGLAAGLLDYALGNYLGIGLAMLLKLI